MMTMAEETFFWRRSSFSKDKPLRDLSP